MKTLLFGLSLLISLGTLTAQQFDYSPGFDAGQPKEMKALESLIGTWEIDLYYTLEKSSPNPEWRYWGKSTSQFTETFDGAFITEQSRGFPIAPPHEGFSNWSYFAVFSYDRLNKVYRVTYNDNIFGLADIYEGQLTDVLDLSDLNSPTYLNHGKNQSKQKNRIVIGTIKEDQFVCTWQSADESDFTNTEMADIPWKWSVKMVYKRVE